MAIQRGSTWQANVRLLNGERLRPGGFESEAAAELWEAQAHLNDTQGLKPPPVDTSRRSLAAKLDRSLTIGELRKKVLGTPYKKGSKVGGWLGSKDFDGADERSALVVKFFGADKMAAEVATTEEIDRLVNACVEIGNSPGTINRKLAAVSKMLAFAEARGLITKLPVIPRLEEYEGKLRFLFQPEEVKLFAKIETTGKHRVLALFHFLIDTGARFSEAVRLGHGDVGTGATFWVTKGGSSRTVPLTGRAKRACEAGRDLPRGPFSDIEHWMARDTIDRAKKALGGLDDVTIHTLRHTCCSRLVMGGWDLRRVQVWMGHETITTTLRYAHLAPGALGADMAATLEQASRRPLSVVEPTANDVSNLVSAGAQRVQVA